jgi:tetratricopeptide (TPR) repeat protein
MRQPVEWQERAMKFASHWAQTKVQIRSAILRQVPGGYVFRAPNPRLFGASDHYLVNEAQRDEIVAIMTPRRMPLILALWLGGFLLAIGAGLIVLGPSYPATVTIGVIAAMMLAAILGAQLSASRKLRRLQPILAGATRSEQRITLAEISQTIRDGKSYPELRRLAVINSIAAVFAASAAAAQIYLRKPHVGMLSDPMSLLLCLSALICAGAAATSFVQLRQKARQRDGAAGADPLSGGLPRRLLTFWSCTVVVCLVAILSMAVRAEFSDDRQGLRYQANGEHDKAITSFSHAIAAQPGNPDVYLHRATSYTAKGDHGRAVADYTRAIAIEPSDAAVYRNRGIAYHNTGDQNRAIADYDTSIAHDPDNPYTYYYRGLSYDAKKDGDRAIADFTKAIALRPQDPYSYSARARAFEAKGDHDRAIADFGKAIEINPKDSYAYSARGRIFEARGDRERADSDFDKAIAADPNNYFAYYFRGFALHGRGEHDRAIADLTKAIEIHPGNASSYATRAQDFEAKGEHARAIADYKKILDFPAASDAERRTQDFARQRIAQLTSSAPAPGKLP